MLPSTTRMGEGVRAGVLVFVIEHGRLHRIPNMQTLLTAAQLLLDLIALPFLLGAVTAALMLRFKRKPKVLRWSLVTGAMTALAHATGVLLQLWKDGDWLGYFIMLIVTALMISWRS